MNIKNILMAIAFVGASTAFATTDSLAQAAIKEPPIFKFDGVELLECPKEKPQLMLVTYVQQNTRFHNLGVCEKSSKLTRTLLKDIAEAFLIKQVNQDYAIFRIDPVVDE